MDWDDVARILAALPGTEVGTSYRTPAVRVRKRLLVRLREDGETLVVHGDPALRAALLAEGDPPFFTLPHYDGPDSPYVLVRLPVIPEELLREVLSDAWTLVAPAGLVASWRASDAGCGENGPTRVSGPRPPADGGGEGDRSPSRSR